MFTKMINITLSSFAITVMLLGSSSYSGPIDVTIGNQWKEQCAGQGRYTCCKKKERECIAGGIGDATCGRRYTQCTKKFRPGQAGKQSQALENPVLTNPYGSTTRTPTRPATKKSGGALK